MNYSAADDSFFFLNRDKFILCCGGRDFFEFRMNEMNHGGCNRLLINLSNASRVINCRPYLQGKGGAKEKKAIQHPAGRRPGNKNKFKVKIRCQNLCTRPCVYFF